MVYVIFFFFFQAEDGIRDYKVTGVQTCALPIWMMPPGVPYPMAQRPRMMPPGGGMQMPYPMGMMPPGGMPYRQPMAYPPQMAYPLMMPGRPLAYYQPGAMN